MHKYDVGKCYYFRTVTMIYTGKLLAEESDYFALTKAAWIADTGRFATAMKTLKFSEVEPYPAEKIVRIYKSGILDTMEIDEIQLPLEQIP